MNNTTGGQLRERRERAGVLAYELGSQMGVHSSRVSQIEALSRVTPRTEQRYLDALASLLLAKTANASPVEATGAA